MWNPRSPQISSIATYLTLINYIITLSITQQRFMKKNVFDSYFERDNANSENRLIGDISGDLGSKKMTELFDMPRICLLHREKIEGICLAPCCDNYKELCSSCLKDHGHRDWFRTWPQAVDQAKKLLKNCLNKLEVTRKRKQQDYQKYLRHNMVLCQIQKNLDRIQEIIVEKIRNFKQNIKNIYSQNVNAKLNELDQIMLNSNKALQEQLKNIRKNPYQNLSHIFSKDRQQEIQYYDSYFNEIFVSKTRNFKSLDNDRIMALIVSFEQNLVKIFNYNVEKEKEGADPNQFHILRNQGQLNKLYTLSKGQKGIDSVQLPDNKRLAHLSEKQEYQWVGIPQSIYYKPKNCYFIIGEGQKISKSIVKWNCNKPLSLHQSSSQFLEDAFIKLRPMQTERRFFAICELGGEIYIVGGQNEKEGCLSRCEKIVPQYNSQIYLIHSLNCKSSRHSLTTYKNKYILKFGGIKTMWPQDQELESLENITAPPQIYSTQTEQWLKIEISKELSLKFGLYPSIFKSQNKNMLLILGGQLCKQPSSINVSIVESKGFVEELKLRTNNYERGHHGMIFNSSIKVDEEQNICSFFSSDDEKGKLTLERKRMFHRYH